MTRRNKLLSSAAALPPKRSQIRAMQTCTQFSQLPPEAFVRLPVVLQVTGLSRSHLYLSIKNLRFPAGHKLSAHASGWRVADLRRWLSDPTGWNAAPAGWNAAGHGEN